MVWIFFPYIGNNHPNWLIFIRGVETTNQMRWIITGHCCFWCVLMCPGFKAWPAWPAWPGTIWYHDWPPPAYTQQLIRITHWLRRTSLVALLSAAVTWWEDGFNLDSTNFRQFSVKAQFPSITVTFLSCCAEKVLQLLTDNEKAAANELAGRLFKTWMHSRKNCLVGGFYATKSPTKLGVLPCLTCLQGRFSLNL